MGRCGKKKYTEKKPSINSIIVREHMVFLIIHTCHLTKENSCHLCMTVCIGLSWPHMAPCTKRCLNCLNVPSWCAPTLWDICLPNSPCLPWAFQQAKAVVQHDLSFTTLQAPLAFPTTKQSHPRPTTPLPQKKYQTTENHTKCSAKVCCVLFPLLVSPVTT